MSKPGGSAQAKNVSLRGRRRRLLRRRWPVVLVGVLGAFASGYFLPRLILSAASPILEALAPGSPALEEPGFLADFSLALGTLMAGAAAVGLLRPSRSEVAWGKGASGERRVGRVLDGLRRHGVSVLHDRTIPGSRANIDHLVVTSAGVFTVETKRYTGKLEARARSGQVWINYRNRTNLLDQARRQAQAVADALTGDGFPGVPVTSVLCFVDTTLPLLMPKQVGGVMIYTPNMLRRHLSRTRSSSELSLDQMALIVECLDAVFRPSAAL